MVRLIALQSPDWDIEHLDAAIKMRPLMYIGSIRDCLVETAHLFMQEALDSRCSRIDIQIIDEYAFSVTGLSNETDLTVVEQDVHLLGKLFTEFYSFSEYLDIFWSMKALAIVSTRLTIEAYCHDRVWSRDFAGGILIKSIDSERIESDLQGSKITIRAHLRDDMGRVTNGTLDEEILSGMFSQKAALIPGLRITIQDARDTSAIQNMYQFKDGLRSLLRVSMPVPGYDQDEIIDGEFSTEIIAEESDPPYSLRVHFACHLSSWKPNRFGILSFVNTRQTVFHGVHVDAFVSAATKAINQHADKLDNPCYTTPFEHVNQEIVARKISLVISVWYPNPKSDNSMGWQLSNQELYDPIFDFAYKQIMEWGKVHPTRMGEAVFRFCPGIGN